MSSTVNQSPAADRLGPDDLSRRELLRRGILAAGTCATAVAAAEREAAAAEPLPEGFIDAHAHVWTPDVQRYPLKADFSPQRMAQPSFTPEQLLAHCRPCGVSRVVLIQVSYYGFDNSYMLDALRQHPGLFSAVGMIDENARPRDKMLELAKQGVRGFRIAADQRAPARWLDGDGMAAMWKCAADERLVLCPLLHPECLPAVDRMCARFPATPVVIDHLARIGADGVIRPADVDTLCGLARHAQVHVKVSAFYALGKKQAPYHDLGPLIRRVRDAFGAQRLLWASDAPFQTLHGHAYQDSIDLIRKGLDFLAPDEREWLLRKTAQRLFFPAEGPERPSGRRAAAG